MANSPISPRVTPLSITIEGESTIEEIAVGGVRTTSDFGFIANQALTIAILNAVNTIGREGYERYEAYNEGEITMGEFAGTVAQKGAKSAAISGTKTIAALYLREGLEELAKRIGKNSFRRFANSYSGTAVAFGIVDQGYDTYRWVGGQISDREYKVSSVQNAGATGGAIGGSIAGAAIGSVVPFLGTGIGAIIGGLFGGYGGAGAGRDWGEKLFEPEPQSPSGNTPEDAD